MKATLIATSTIIATLLMVSVVYAHQAFALKNLFNCITKASSGGSLSFKDYVNCFNQQFHGQLGDHGATFSDSVKP